MTFKLFNKNPKVVIQSIRKWKDCIVSSLQFQSSWNGKCKQWNIHWELVLIEPWCIQIYLRNKRSINRLMQTEFMHNTMKHQHILVTSWWSKKGPFRQLSNVFKSHWRVDDEPVHVMKKKPGVYIVLRIRWSEICLQSHCCSDRMESESNITHSIFERFVVWQYSTCI